MKHIGIIKDLQVFTLMFKTTASSAKSLMTIIGLPIKFQLQVSRTLRSSTNFYLSGNFLARLFIITEKRREPREYLNLLRADFSSWNLLLAHFWEWNWIYWWSLLCSDFCSWNWLRADFWSWNFFTTFFLFFSSRKFTLIFLLVKRILFMELVAS